MTSLEIQQQTSERKTTLVLIGQIDENADYSKAQFAGLEEAYFDFARVTLINSTGLQRWIKFLEAIPRQIAVTFGKCPVRVVNQLNMFPGFLAGRAVTIDSFFAPYYCEACDQSKNVLLSAALFSAQAADQVAPKVKCDHCHGMMEFDGIEKRYFAFLTTPRSA